MQKGPVAGSDLMQLWEPVGQPVQAAASASAAEPDFAEDQRGWPGGGGCM